MKYQAMNFEKLLGTEGFSNQLLTNHFTLYNGYVTNTNKLMDEFAELEKQGKAGDASVCRNEAPVRLGI